MLKLVSGLGSLVFIAVSINLMISNLLPIPFILLLGSLVLFIKISITEHSDISFYKNKIMVLEEKLNNVQPLTDDELKILNEIMEQNKNNI